MNTTENHLRELLQMIEERKQFKRWVWNRDDIGFYITPLIGYSWGKPYGRNIWIGWLRWLFQINFKD